MSVSDFLERHFRHFNARETLAAARAYRDHLDRGGKMLLSMAGAMSTGEIGISLAEMIRQDKVHAISCTAANLEEDFFNLVAHDQYKVIPNYRDLSPDDEVHLQEQQLNRVTDTCIPEHAVRSIEELMVGYWRTAARDGTTHLPCEFFWQLLEDGKLESFFQVPREDSWAIAAWEKKIPVYTPGFEDSTLGNIFAARVIDGTLGDHGAVANGTAQMEQLVNWYRGTCRESSIGFFQIGGGIAGDFAICAVPLIIQDLRENVPYWGYFAQISDSTTSYGSYSGAVPNEKITWSKLDKSAPTFMINSDASIVAPLIFAYILGL
jgi:deoxyhypusine synthase